MAIIVPSVTTPYGDTATNAYAKVTSSSYDNRGSSDPSLSGVVKIYKDKASADANAAPYAVEGFNIVPWAPGGARGTVTAVGLAAHVDGETLVLDDGVNPPVTLEFDFDGSVVETATLRAVPCSAESSDPAVAAQQIAAVIRDIPAAAFHIRVVSVDGAVVNLINCYARSVGNEAISHTVADAGFQVTGMSGGSDTIDLSAEIENYLLTLPAFAGGTRV